MKRIFLISSFYLIFSCFTGFTEIFSTELGYEIKTDNFVLIVNKNGKIGVKDLISKDVSKGFIESLAIIDGKKGNLLELNFISTERKKNSVKIEYKNIEYNLFITEEFIDKGNYIITEVVIANKAQEDAYLNVKFNIPAIYGNKLKYWDGNTEYEKIMRSRERKELFWTFPMSCIYTDKSGIAMGIEPHQIIGYLENGILKDKIDKFYYGVKIVVEKQKDNHVEFVIYGFKGKYRYLEAIDKYYSIAPEMFSPKEGIDKRIWQSCDATRISGEVKSSSPEKVLQLTEYFRRTHAYWTWFYAPFRRAGDWYGRKEYFEDHDYQEWKKSSFQAQFDTLEKFLEWRKRAIDLINKCNVVPVFYIISHCEENLAQKVYSDCIAKDPETRNKIGPGWVHSYSTDNRMFWGGKFEDDTKKDLEKIVKEYNVGGFAIDCAGRSAGGSARFWEDTPSVKEYSGRPFNENGPFCWEGMSVAKMIDYIHSLKRDGKFMGVVTNGGTQEYYIAFRTDSALIEGSIFGILEKLKQYEIEKYMMGKKPRSLYQVLYYHDTVGKSVGFDGENYTPEQCRQIYLDVWNLGLLLSFRYAYLPISDTSYGVVNYMKNIPTLIELIKTGWEIIPAIRLNQNLWVSRYGKDLKTYLFVGNQTKEKKDVREEIDNEYLGEGVYIFETYDGNELINEIKDGVSIVNFSLNPKEHIILKSIANINKQINLKGKATEENELKEGRIFLNIESPQIIITNIKVRIPENSKGKEVKVNGKKVRFDNKEGFLEFETEIGEKTEIEVIWESEIYKISLRELFEYPFVLENLQPNCVIVIDSDADEMDENTAFQMKEYFRFYYLETKGKSVEIPVKKKNEVDSKNIVYIGKNINLKEVVVKKEGSNLMIIGSTSLRRNEIVHDIMNILDKKYLYYGKLGFGTWPKDPASQKMREKAGFVKGKLME